MREIEEEIMAALEAENDWVTEQLAIGRKEWEKTHNIRG